MGTLASVLQLLKLPDGTVKVLVEGTVRAAITRYTDNESYFEAEVTRVEETFGTEDEIEALSRSVVSQFESYVKLNKKISPEVLGTAAQIDDYSKLADTIASHLAIKITEKQQLLEVTTISERLERVFTLMESEISVLQVEKKIRSRVKRQMEKTQREYYLNEQMKAIQKELGDSEEGRDDLAEIEQKIDKTKLSREAREKAKSGFTSAEKMAIRRFAERQAARPTVLDDPARLLAEEESPAREVQRARGVHVDGADGALAERIRLAVPLVVVVLSEVEPAIGPDVDRPRGIRGEPLVADREGPESGARVDDVEALAGPPREAGAGRGVEPAIGGLVDLVDARPGQPLLAAELPELASVEPEEPVVGSGPEIADPILHEALDGRVRETLLLRIRPEGEAAEKRRRRRRRRGGGGRTGRRAERQGAGEAGRGGEKRPDPGSDFAGDAHDFRSGADAPL